MRDSLTNDHQDLFKVAAAFQDNQLNMRAQCNFVAKKAKTGLGYMKR